MASHVDPSHHVAAEKTQLDAKRFRFLLDKGAASQAELDNALSAERTAANALTLSGFGATARTLVSPGAPSHQRTNAVPAQAAPSPRTQSLTAIPSRTNPVTAGLPPSSVAANANGIKPSSDTLRQPGKTSAIKAVEALAAKSVEPEVVAEYCPHTKCVTY